MKYDPVIMFECDACKYTAEVVPEYVFRDYSGKNGYYDDKTAFDKIEDGNEWIDFGDDKYFCSKDCENDYFHVYSGCKQEINDIVKEAK